MFIEISENLTKLSKFFPENLYVVGGYVRNKLLKLECNDVDIAGVVDIDEVAKRLENSPFKVKVKNAKLGSIVISKDGENFEYTTFRKETYEGGGHTPQTVEKTDKLEEDAQRRDFTINAIYYNVNKDEIVDLFHGIVDLNDRIIRTTVEPEKVLADDGVRILRMVRFAGELNFKIDKKTLKVGKTFVKNLKDIQGSRKFVEIDKILCCEQRYKTGNLSRALELLNKLNVWEYFSINKTVDFSMVYKVDDKFLGLLIDIIDSNQPECLQVFLENFLKEQFGLNQTVIKKIFVYLAGYYEALSNLNNKEYFFKYFENWTNIGPLVYAKSKHIYSKYNFFYKYIIEHGLSIRVSDLTIDESDIKLNFPNIDKKNYDKILNNLLSKVFDGKIENQKECLLREIKRKLQNY